MNDKIQFKCFGNKFIVIFYYLKIYQIRPKIKAKIMNNKIQFKRFGNKFIIIFYVPSTRQCFC